MSLYAIGDLHLSFTSNKPMDVFGKRWEGYIDKLTANFSALGEDDVTVLCGDGSWAMDLEAAAEDFKFMDRLPGRKILLKGNHDYWWNTATKIHAFFEKIGVTTLDILHNNCYFYKNAAICGTRGWFYEEDSGGEHDKKIMARELLRLETSLKAAGDAEKFVFLHYPPRFNNYVCKEVVEILNRYDVKTCAYGHIHGPAIPLAVTGTVEGIDYKMVSADAVDFKPVRILD